MTTTTAATAITTITTMKSEVHETLKQRRQRHCTSCMFPVPMDRTKVGHKTMNSMDSSGDQKRLQRWQLSVHAKQNIDTNTKKKLFKEKLFYKRILSHFDVGRGWRCRANRVVNSRRLSGSWGTDSCGPAKMSTLNTLSTCAPTKNVHRTQFQRLQLLRFPRPKLQETNEARYWKKFKLSAAHKLDFMVNNVDISPSKPHDIIATSGGKICIYNGRNHRLKRTITKFAATANCGVYRGDGKLIAAGSQNVVKVFQAEQSGPPMRTFKGHAGEVTTVGFSNGKVHVLSGSNDTTARYWDLASGECVRTLKGHTDYVRSLAAHPTNPDMWLTSGYDHTVKLWDLRTQQGDKNQGPSLTIDHGEPIEKIVVLPGGNVVLSAGGSVVKAWDLLTGGQMLHCFSNHQKTVTSLAVDGTGSRLLSGGLDGHIKIHDLSTYRISHALKYQVLPHMNAVLHSACRVFEWGPCCLSVGP